MGSPIFPVLANVYADDTFTIVKCDDLKDLHSQLYNVDPAMKFGIEVETPSGTLPFLDCVVHRTAGKLTTTLPKTN